MKGKNKEIIIIIMNAPLAELSHTVESACENIPYSGIRITLQLGQQNYRYSKGKMPNKLLSVPP